MSFIHKTESFYQQRASQPDLEPDNERGFLWDAETLCHLMSYFQEPRMAMCVLAQMGGVEGIAYGVKSCITTGLTNVDIEYRRSIFGTNQEATRESASLLGLCWEEAKDPMLRILLVAAGASIVTGVIQDPSEGWTDGLAILLAVLIVVFVGGFNNYQKEKQFRIREAESKKKSCLVLRDGQETEISFDEVVVGDLVVLRTGFTVPADGVFALGSENLKAQEAGLTGESKELRKNRLHPLLMKGTNVVSGEGLMVAVAVGDRTEWGQLMAKLTHTRGLTPLQVRLKKLGAQIGWAGLVLAVVLFVVLVIYWAIDDRTDGVNRILGFFITAVTLVVVAVPEGLPLAVAISLAYSMQKMLKDNNFVRHLQACETMGNATTICSDKTGTLTTNMMSVSQCHLFGSMEFFTRLPTRKDLTIEDAEETSSTAAYQRLVLGVCVNTKSFQDQAKTKVEQDAIAAGRVKTRLIGGNQTDCAILQWVIDLGADNYKAIREQNPVLKFFPFDSKMKRSAVLLRDTLVATERYVLYVKGAAEQILGLCSFVMDGNGEPKPKTPQLHANVERAMSVMSQTGLRCLGVCYASYAEKDIPFKSESEHVLEDEDALQLFADMIWIGCVGIADPVRTEVPDAVKTCQKAGIVVRMVTGDHLETARHIAKQCGILTCSEHICMTGAQFRQLSDDDKRKMLPRLRVLARSKPADNEELVLWYKLHNEPNDIVAVTGDGANDALALKNADVGLSMGIQGTDVAKEASDIIIMDDNFASIEKTVMWGRSVYDNIRKFIQFQLTVNVAACTISLVGAFYPPWNDPLTPVQLLWINLIMDTMGALALATEQPTRKLLNRHPFKKGANIVNQILWRFILGHALYQLAVLLITLIFGKEWLDISDETLDEHGRNWHHLTVVFNVFVCMTLFNEINARKVNNERNIFVGILSNWIFWLIMTISVVAQILLVQLFGRFANTVPLTLKDWGYCLVCGAGSLVWHQVVISVPVNLNEGIQVVDTATLFKEEPNFAPEYHQVTAMETANVTDHTDYEEHPLLLHEEK